MVLKTGHVIRAYSRSNGNLIPGRLELGIYHVSKGVEQGQIIELNVDTGAVIGLSGVEYTVQD